MSDDILDTTLNIINSPKDMEFGIDKKGKAVCFSKDLWKDGVLNSGL